MLTIPMLFAFLLVLASAFQSPNLLLCLGWQDGRASRCLLKKHHFLLPTRFVRVHVSPRATHLGSVGCVEEGQHSLHAAAHPVISRSPPRNQLFLGGGNDG